MRTTNEHNLPVAFERFEKRNPHDPQGARFTVSTLIDSPYIAHLRRKHYEERTEDVSDRLHAIMGSAIHKILEDGHDPESQIAEERLHGVYHGVSVSGQIDLQNLTEKGVDSETGEVIVTRTVEDWKSTKTATVRYNPNGKLEWERQLNCYAELARYNGYHVTGLVVHVYFRDWEEAGLKRYRDYPPIAYQRFDIAMWEPEVARQYMLDRVALHIAEQPMPCTDEEMWARGTSREVFVPLTSGKGHRKRSEKFDNDFDADMFMLDNPGSILKETEKTYTRCNGDWCQVAEFCPIKQKRSKTSE